MVKINFLIEIFIDIGKDKSSENIEYNQNTELSNIDWLDSLGWTLLYNEIENRFNYSLPIDELLECQTIQDILLLINSNGSK